MPPHTAAAGLLLWARQEGDTVDCFTAGVRQANAGSATLSAFV